MKLTRVLTSLLIAGCLALSCHQSLRAESEEPYSNIAKARELLDTYYGSRENLRLAGMLLQTAIANDSRNADAYVEAARLTIMGGHIVRDEFKRNTVESYHALLDKALSIDPSNWKAHILKAEAYDIQGNYSEEKASLDRAKALNATSPWLQMGYARYYDKMNDNPSAYYLYSQVEALGPGRTPSQRMAYVSALSEMARFKPPPGSPLTLKELAGRAWRERYPTDAWTLGNFADQFIFRGMYDDAIVYAKEAVRTMDYGAGRLTLEVSLYGKAAQLITQGRTSEANKFIAEARQIGFSALDVLASLERLRSSEQVETLMPTLRKIVK